MSEATAAADQESHRLNPWFSIWLHPRRTVRSVLKRPENQWSLLLPAAASLIYTPFLYLLFPLSWSRPAVNLAAVAGAVAVGMTLFALDVWACASTAKTLGGTGDRKKVRRALCCAAIVWIWSPVYLIASGCLLLLVAYLNGADSLERLAPLVQLPWLIFPLFHFIAKVAGISESTGIKSTQAVLAVILARGLVAVVLVIPAIVGLAIYLSLRGPG